MIDEKTHNAAALDIAEHFLRLIEGYSDKEATLFLVGSAASQAAYSALLIADAKAKDRLLASMLDRIEKLEELLAAPQN